LQGCYRHWIYCSDFFATSFSSFDVTTEDLCVLICTVPRTEKLTTIRRIAVMIGAQSRVPLEPLNTIVLWCTESFRGALIWVPMMPGIVNLSDNYTFDRCANTQNHMRRSELFATSLYMNKKFDKLKNCLGLKQFGPGALPGLSFL